MYGSLPHTTCSPLTSILHLWCCSFALIMNLHGHIITTQNSKFTLELIPGIEQTCPTTFPPFIQAPLSPKNHLHPTASSFCSPNLTALISLSLKNPFISLEGKVAYGEEEIGMGRDGKREGSAHWCSRLILHPRVTASSMNASSCWLLNWSSSLLMAWESSRGRAKSLGPWSSCDAQNASLDWLQRKQRFATLGSVGTLPQATFLVLLLSHEIPKVKARWFEGKGQLYMQMQKRDVALSSTGCRQTYRCKRKSQPTAPISLFS